MKGQTNQYIHKTQLQKKLRNAPTDTERTLWLRLKRRQLEDCKFRRQHPYGHYILDFVCLERHLIVELDGSQHLDASDYDARRTRHLEHAGFVVLRFWNNEVFDNMEGVLEVIQQQLIACAKPIPTQPSP